MTQAPSQSQHANSDRQFQEDQPETFLLQLKFPNPIKIPNLFTIKTSPRVYALASASSHPLPAKETGTVQQAAAISYTWGGKSLSYGAGTEQR